jgi:hypothetical protein
MPAIEQPRRHHIQGLEILVYQGKHLLQMGQHSPGELIHQEGAARV